MSSSDKVPKNVAKRPQGGGGSRKGIPNKSTAMAREAIARFVDGNAGRLQEWLDQIADDPKHGPAAAFDRFMDVVEYHIPKLARTEHTGENGGPVRIIASQDDQNL
jgi:hypothetical protein